MQKGYFQIELDTHILDELRGKINEQPNISYNKIYGKHRAWDRLCAIMDRLDDTVFYLNDLKLNTGKYTRSAFDFYDFMNNASVVVDCVKELAKIFSVPDDVIKLTTNIFKKLGNDTKGTDENYFEYLRSLCSVHPVDTSRHRRYQENDFECCPFVLWNNGVLWHNDNCDIHAVVYTSNDSEHKRIQIYIAQISEYVKTRLNFVSEIIKAIDEYHEEIISQYRIRRIKKEKEFDNYVDYLQNLYKEQEDRLGNDALYPFNYVINLFQLRLTNPVNQEKFDLYLNAFRYAIGFEHNSLQNMSYEGLDNNGLIYTSKNIETSLFILLYNPDSGSSEQRRYGYNLNKICYLSYEAGDGDKQWAYVQLKEALPFLEKYVSLEKAQDDFEHYALVQLALYLDCLENICLLNKNIPNDLKYRERLLTNDEWNHLIAEEENEENWVEDPEINSLFE